MTVVLPRSRFLHIPKTGGTWVSRVLGRSGLRLERHEAIPHLARADAPGSGRFTFAFVRCPLAWYRSYWLHRATHGWNPHWWDLDRDCRAPTFAAFMGRVFERQPGYYTRLVRDYVGPPDDEIDFIGRQEYLAADLLLALDLAGERYDPTFPEVVTTHAPANVSPPFPDEDPPDYESRVREMDAATFARFSGPPRPCPSASARPRVLASGRGC